MKFTMASDDKKARLISRWHKIKIEIQLMADKNNLYFREKEVWWASLGANLGHEEDGKNKKFERPVLILKKFNRHLILVIPLTSKIKEDKFYYYKFAISGEEFVSALICQIRLISSKRLSRKIGKVNNQDFKEIKYRIKGFL